MPRKTLLDQAQEKIVELKNILNNKCEECDQLVKEVAEQKKYVEMYRKDKDKLILEIDAVHTALDALQVVRKTGTDSWSPDMNIASRLFAWQAGANIKGGNNE